MTVISRHTNHRKRTTFTFANFAEQVQIFRQDCQHITLLRFIAPNLQRIQAMFFQRHITQREFCTTSSVIHQFRERIRQTACAHIVNRNNRIFVRAQLPATVNHFLRSAFNLGVAALHGIEIQIRIIAACVHRRSRATAQTD